MTPRTFIAILIALLLGGCTGDSKQWNSEMPYPPTSEPQVGDILHVATGHFLSETQMLTNANKNRIIYVGELHDNPASHRLELLVLKSMFEKNPTRVALGMEMFTTGQQDILDNWVAGKLSEKEFLKQSKWFSEGWRFNFGYYRDILVFCRDNGIPVVGLNVDKELGRQVSMTPFADMTPEMRTSLPQMNMNDPYQRAMIEAMIADHAGGSKMADSFHRRQTLWDETMAQSVSDYIQANPDMNMLVIAGNWHIEYGFGIPRRVFGRLPLTYTIIGSKTIKIAEGKDPQLMNIKMPMFPMPEADYIVYQEYELLPNEEVRLGVLLEDKDEEPGVLVFGVMPGSVADRAGISKGERIISIDGEAVSENFDLIYIVKNKSVGDSATLDIANDKGERRVKITFIADTDKHHGR